LEGSMLKKRNDGDLPVPFEPGEGLAEERVTRARAIKLLGAMGATGAFALFTGGTAEAGERDRRRRRRRRRRLRRRRRNVTTTNTTTETSTVNFGSPLAPTTVPVTIANNGPDDVTLKPTIVGEGFSLANTDPITIKAGDTAVLPVTFDPRNIDGAQTGNLKLVDVADKVVLEDIDLLGTGLL
jgi:hypothetical protein